MIPAAALPPILYWQSEQTARRNEWIIVNGQALVHPTRNVGNGGLDNLD
jgi:hypothetical protein